MRQNRIIIVGAVFYAVMVSALRAQPLSLQPTKLTVPEKYTRQYRSSSTITVPDSVRLPEGFRINVFHAGMMKPRFFAWNPRGVLHIVDMSAEAVFALPDRDGDGVADTAYVAAAPVQEAHNVVFALGAMFVTEPTRVLKFLDRDGDGVYETRSVFIDSIPNGGVFNHYTRTLLFDSTHNAFYLSVGAPCDACRADDPERAAILRFNADGTGRRIFATGLRNAIGMTIEPATGQLWATNADRNGLGEDKPEEIVSRVPDGSFHGWPIAFSVSAGKEEPRKEWTNFQANADYRAMLPLSRADSSRVAAMHIAEAFLPAHSTPMGIEFYSGSLLPPYYRNAAFVAVHGSYSTDSRKVAVGYNVALVRLDEASGQYRTQDFLNGFLTDSLTYKHWGRPCGIGFSPNGDMYVSSDGAIGALYRVSFTSPLTAARLSSSAGSDFPSLVFPQSAAPSDALWLDFVAPISGNLSCTVYDVRGANVAEYSMTVRAGKCTLRLNDRFSLRKPLVLAAEAYLYRLTLADGAQIFTSRGMFLVSR